jgi:hypothetical protein
MARGAARLDQSWALDPRMLISRVHRWPSRALSMALMNRSRALVYPTRDERAPA